MYAENNNGKAFFYSILVYILLCIFCLMGYISLPYAKEEVNMGGIEVNIGTSDKGMGSDFSSTENPSAAPRPNHRLNTEKTSAVQPTKASVDHHAAKEVLTQNTEDAASVSSAKKTKSVPADEGSTESKRPVEKLNANALYKGARNSGTGEGDGNTNEMGNQGKPNGSVLSNSYSGTGNGGGGIALNLEGRKFLSRPSLTDDGQTEGRIAVDITVDRDGNITTAKAGGRGTTIQNAALWRKCEEAAKEAKLNSISEGPEIQAGKVIFSFKLQ